MLPEKNYFKIQEIVDHWKKIDSNCSVDQIIQVAASGNLAIHCYFNNFVVAEGVYRGKLPINGELGKIALQILLFDQRYNNPLTMVYPCPTIDLKFPFNFKIYKKDQVKVFLQRLSDSWDTPPTTLILGEHYDVNIRNKYVEILIPLTSFDQIAIIAHYGDILSELNAYAVKDFEQVRSEDIKVLITEEKVLIEYLHIIEPNRFKCLVERKDLNLPYITKNDLYISKEERARFEKEHSLNIKKNENQIENQNLAKTNVNDQETIAQRNERLIRKAVEIHKSNSQLPLKSVHLQIVEEEVNKSKVSESTLKKVAKMEDIKKIIKSEK